MAHGKKITPQTKFNLDDVHVARTIDNFDVDHPLIPWTRLSGMPHYYRGMEIWWNEWHEEFGLYAPDTRQLFELKPKS